MAKKGRHSQRVNEELKKQYWAGDVSPSLFAI